MNHEKKVLIFLMTAMLVFVSLTAFAQENETQEKITFDSETVFGDAIDSSIFAENEVTLVNIFATWCGPCVKEIPELEEIAAADNGIGVVGMLADAVNMETGLLDDEAIALSLVIAEKTGALYPFVIPDPVFLEEYLKKAMLFPMSYLVDSEGVVIQGPIGGARTQQEWLDLIAEAVK